MAVEPAAVDTLNHHAVMSVIVKRVSPEDRKAFSLLRQTHAIPGENERGTA